MFNIQYGRSACNEEVGRGFQDSNIDHVPVVVLYFVAAIMFYASYSAVGQEESKSSR